MSKSKLTETKDRETLSLLRLKPINDDLSHGIKMNVHRIGPRRPCVIWPQPTSLVPSCTMFPLPAQLSSLTYVVSSDFPLTTGPLHMLSPPPGRLLLISDDTSFFGKPFPTPPPAGQTPPPQPPPQLRTVSFYTHSWNYKRLSLH